MLKLAPCPQVECNSKLDPTTTTFLKVSPASSPHGGRGPGRGLLGSRPGLKQDSESGQQSLSRWGPLSSPHSLPADGRFWRAPSSHTGETRALLPLHHLLGPGGQSWESEGASPTPPQAACQSLCCPTLPQPGKLTEAFKYFLQGMGYSKYPSTQPHYRLVGQGHAGRAGTVWVPVPRSLWAHECIHLGPRPRAMLPGPHLCSKLHVPG